MPLFEYQCRSCGQRFEFLTRDGQSPACPACDSAELEKQLSVFAVGAKGDRAAPPDAGSPCATCCDARGRGGTCPVN